MRKNGRTIREDIPLIHRGVKEFNRILPGQMRQVFMRGLLAAVIPFLTTAVSAFIIDRLLEKKSVGSMVPVCLAGLGSLFLLSVWRAVKDGKIAVGASRLFDSHEIALTNKSYGLLYEELEKSSTRQLRDEVAGSINISGAGMASLYWDMETLFTSSCIVVLSVVISARYLYEIFIWDSVSNHTFANALWLLVIIFGLIAVCAYITCKTSSKRFDVSFEVFKNGAKYSRYGEFYTLEYLKDENAAMDARIYEQEQTVLAECQEKCYRHFSDGKRKEINALNLFDGIKFLCSCACGCIIYILLGQKAMQGAIGSGSILLMYAVVTMSIEALSQIAQTITDLRNNNEHLIRFFKYMDLPEAEVAEGKNGKGNIRIQQLEFRNVSFRYPESSQYVLKNINLTITAGEKLAIVGENGSGKTTLIKLVCRLYRPIDGKIYLNGQDIWDYPYQDYIDCISTVFQDFSLFAFTLAQNVASSMAYEEQKVSEVLIKAGLGERIKCCEKGIRQVLFHDFDENGTDLSGGEQQKVAIARAVYKGSELMILDEPTAALDPYAEYEVYRKFGEITMNKTLISISHRLSACRSCDRIVVMGDGEILQNGSHEQLLEDSAGKYCELWNAQAQYYC